MGAIIGIEVEAVHELGANWSANVTDGPAADGNERVEDDSRA